MKKRVVCFVVATTVALVMMPSATVEAQEGDCEACDWCVPGAWEYEACWENGLGYPNCSDMDGCWDQICTHGPWGERCDAQVDLVDLQRRLWLAEQQGAGLREELVVGSTLLVYSGKLSTSVPGLGDAEATASYVAYRQRNTCAERQKRLLVAIPALLHLPSP